MENEVQKIVANNLEKDFIIKEKKGRFFQKKKRVVHAVKGISLEIPKGKIIGLLGINGAGKTTTIRMLSSVITPTRGTLTMNGKDAVQDHMWVKGRINVITGGERNLYWRLNAVENLEYFGSLYGIGRQECKRRARELLKQVGLEDAAKIPVERYSKGMKQRLQVARGLINNPEYIFLDEPTLGLDIVIAKEIRNLVYRLAKEENRGVLLTTHYISEAEELCDEIYVLDKGEMIANGTKQELKELFACPQKLIIYTNGLTKMCEEELINAGIDNLLQAELEIIKSRELCITGKGACWGAAMEILLKYQTDILHMEMKEPALEDILMRLINQSRERRIS